MRLNQTRLEAFLGFARREFLNPSEEEKQELVERDGKWWRADEAVFGLRIYTMIQPGLQKDPLLKKVMPGSKDPKTTKPTAVTLDSVDGLYLGDGQGAANENAVLPIQFDFPAVEIREVALGIVRNAAKEVTGLELTTVIAAKLGDAVGLQIGGAGVTIALDGPQTPARCSRGRSSPRWPDADRAARQGRPDQRRRLPRAQGPRPTARAPTSRSSSSSAASSSSRSSRSASTPSASSRPSRSRWCSSWGCASRPRSS